MGRGNGEPKTVGVTQPEDSRTMRGSYRIGIQSPAPRLDGSGKRISVLIGRELKRHAFTLRSLQALRTVILGEENTNRSRPQRYCYQRAIPLVTSVDLKAKYVSVPGDAPVEVRNGQ